MQTVMQKELSENIKPFSSYCNIPKKGRGPATPTLWASDFLDNFLAFAEAHLITGKRIKWKYQTVLELLQYIEKRAWPCHAHTVSIGFFKIIFPAFPEVHLITGKRIKWKYPTVLQLLQYSEKWAWPCHAPLGAPPCSTKFPKLV